MASIGLSRAMIVAIVAVVSVVLIAAVVLFYLSGDDGDGGGEETFQVGDFVEYGTFYYYEGNFPGDPVGYTRYTITDIDDEWITVQATYLDPARDELMTQTMHWPANSTGFAYAASGVDYITYTVSDLGTDTVDTEWGEVSAHHYQYSYESVGNTYTVDIWTRGGFYLLQRTTSDVDPQGAIILTNTNIASIYS